MKDLLNKCMIIWADNCEDSRLEIVSKNRFFKYNVYIYYNRFHKIEICKILIQNINMVLHFEPKTENYLQLWIPVYVNNL